VPDRLDRRFPLPALAAALSLAAAVLGCQPHDPAATPPPSDGGTPCVSSGAVAANEVVIAAGVCNPWCIRVTAGTSVYFYNNDPALYLFVADPALSYDVQVPGYAGAVTLPLAAGTWTFTAVQAPSATVTIFAQ
jgi:hypothetical protein